MINALVVCYVLNLVLGYSIYLTMLWLGAGQVAACYGLGYPLLLLLEKHRQLLN